MANKFLIKHPLITEKATAMTALNKYFFVVAKEATAPEIKKAIELIYKTKVARVQVLNTKPKQRRIGQTISMKPGYKKAVVTLKEGQTIELAV